MHRNILFSLNAPHLMQIRLIKVMERCCTVPGKHAILQRSVYFFKKLAIRTSLHDAPYEQCSVHRFSFFFPLPCLDCHLIYSYSESGFISRCNSLTKIPQELLKPIIWELQTHTFSVFLSCLTRMERLSFRVFTISVGFLWDLPNSGMVAAVDF